MACFTKTQQRNGTNCEFEKSATMSKLFVLNSLDKSHRNSVRAQYVCDKSENARVCAKWQWNALDWCYWCVSLSFRTHPCVLAIVLQGRCESTALRVGALYYIWYYVLLTWATYLSICHIYQYWPSPTISSTGLGPILYLWLRKRLSANGRRRYKCNFFCNWQKPCSPIASTKSGLTKLIDVK